MQTPPAPLSPASYDTRQTEEKHVCYTRDDKWWAMQGWTARIDHTEPPRERWDQDPHNSQECMAQVASTDSYDDDKNDDDDDDYYDHDNLPLVRLLQL